MAHKQKRKKCGVIKNKMLNLFLQKCTPKMEANLKSMDDWTVVEIYQEGIKLLETIRNIPHQHYGKNKV